MLNNKPVVDQDGDDDSVYNTSFDKEIAGLKITGLDDEVDNL